MRNLLLTFLLLASTTGFLRAAENPFDRASDDLFTGRFVGKDVSLRLKPNAGEWSGELIFKGDRYTIKGQQKEGALRGNFNDGSEDYKFTLQGEGDKFTFTANTFTSTLERQKPARLKGVYQSKRVKLDFKNKDDGYNGTIEFRGKQYEFSAKDVAGTLEGMFKSGDESFPFSLRMDKASLLFKTGTFEDVISLAERRGQIEQIKKQIKDRLEEANTQLPGCGGNPVVYIANGHTEPLSFVNFCENGNVRVGAFALAQKKNVDSLFEMYVEAEPEQIAEIEHNSKLGMYQMNFKQALELRSDENLDKDLEQKTGLSNPGKGKTVRTVQLYGLGAGEVDKIRAIITDTAQQLGSLKKLLAEAQNQLP